MLKNLSGWHRLFIVFAGVWSVVSICLLILILRDISEQRDDSLLTELLNEKKITSIPPGEKGNLFGDIKIIKRDYYKEIRNQIFFFFGFWLAPIGLVYGAGWTTWWVIRGFRKEK